MELASNTNLILWLGIGFCITQSAMFSGLKLAFFSVPRLRLEIEATNKNKAAIKVLRLRQDSNFLLATILWVAHPLVNMGRSYLALGLPERAIPLQERALEIRERIGELRRARKAERAGGTDADDDDDYDVEVEYVP